MTKKADHDSFYYIKTTDVPIMTINIESRLGSRISDSSAIEFVTYIPSKQPLYILVDPQNSKLVNLLLSIFNISILEFYEIKI